MENVYVSPYVEILEYVQEGVLCSSNGGSTENVDIEDGVW